MIGLDTNILIRYIVRDDISQTNVATELIETMCTKDNPGYINLVVLCELSWVLIRGYKYSKKIVADVIRNILTAVELEVEESDTVWRALTAYEKQNADFADFIIGAHNRANNVISTYTFDRKAALHPDFTLLKE